MNKIICDDSKNLSQYVPANSVALTITSPPYRNAINYSKHVKNLKNGKKNRFRGDMGLSTSKYLDEMEKIFSNVHKVTIPGGFCCIVIGDELENGTMVPLPSLLISRLVKENPSENDWHLRDMIVWNKVTAGRNGGGNRFGIFVQNPLPTYFRTNIMHEYIIILQKGKKGRILGKNSAEPIPLNRAMKRQVSLSVWDIPLNHALKRQSSLSVWDITPVPPRVVEHPAVFPEQIPWRLITLYSKVGDTVMDPMNGSGQTTKVAKQLGRRYIGIDKRKAYVKLAKERLEEDFMLSNFMIPLYLPIEWTNKTESGKKEDAKLDLIFDVPKGYKYVFQEKSSKEVLGVRGIYLYYKNKAGDWICYIIARSSKPTRINLGNFNDPKSPLQQVLNNIPNYPFNKARLNEFLPTRLVENRQPIKAVIDVLEKEKFLRKTGTKKGSSVLYEKIIPKKYNKIRNINRKTVSLEKLVKYH